MKNILPNVYLLGAGVALLSFFLILGLKILLSTKVARWIGATKNRWDDIVADTIERTSQFFILATSLYIGFHFIPHPKSVALFIWRIYFVVLMWQISVWSFSLLDKWISSAIRKRTQKNPATANSISLIQLVFRFVLFSMLFLFTLSNLGIRITTIIAGLGVGGIAVALALQKILGDLFSSLSIVLDKPFVVGDFVVVEQYMGTVEKIGLKTTRLRSLSGEQIIISNSDLLGTRIRNFKRMHERRVVQLFSINYDTDQKLLKTAVETVEAVIRSKDRVRFERCHFMKITPTSLDIEAVYWVLSDDHGLHMDIQQEILYEIRKIFLSEGIDFAHPISEILIRSEYFNRVKENTSPNNTIRS